MKDAMILLSISAALTSLVTEAIKKMANNKSLPTNLVAAICSVLCAGLVCAGYIILMDIVVNLKIIVYIVAIVILSWLCAMLGFDKIKQTILQLQTNKE